MQYSLLGIWPLWSSVLYTYCYALMFRKFFLIFAFSFPFCTPISPPFQLLLPLIFNVLLLSWGKLLLKPSQKYQDDSPLS